MVYARIVLRAARLLAGSGRWFGHPKDAFYNPKTGLWNASKIYKKLKAQGVKVKLKDVKAVLDQQLVTQVYKPVPKKKKDRYITIIANPASNTKPICSTSS
eukprot:gene18445-35536_t